MATQAFLIADPRAGVQRNLEPAWLPNDAYPDLQDCYIWRGRLHKRKGYELLGRLQRMIGTTDMSGNFTSSALLNVPLTAGLSQFSCSTSVYQDNGSAGDSQTLLVSGTGTANLVRSTGVLTLTGGPASKAVYYFPGLPVMGLRSLETLTENEDGTIAFDTSYSYLFSGGIFTDLTTYKASTAPFVWHGANYDLFWTSNYQRAMFTTNEVGGLDGIAYTSLTAGGTTSIVIPGDQTKTFVAGDYVFIYPNTLTTTFPMVGTTVEYQGSGSIASSTHNIGPNTTTIVVNVATTNNSNTGTIFNLTRNIGNGSSVGDSVKWLDQDKSGWVNFQPPLNGAGTATNYLQSCEMIFAYKGRLIVLNTTEGTFSGTSQYFYQRARWSQNGTVYYANPIPTNYAGGVDPQAWRDDVIGKGGYIDAPTLEQIVSAQFVKDTLIVYFERSTWQLRYTGNELLPFVWEKINTELGAESTFSVVPFDLQTIALGDVGIHACDSVNVQRIDTKIPDEVFSIQNVNNGAQRVFGIRDFFFELVYWSVPYNGINTEEEQGTSAPIVFPNKLIVYNYIDKSFSFFNDSFTCFGYYQPTNTITWGNTNIFWGNDDVLWSDPQVDTAFAVNVLGGNQQGFVHILMQQSSNDVSLFISNISGTTVTSPNHNLQPNMYIKLVSASGITSGIGVIYRVVSITDPNNFVIDAPVSGTFTGSGTIAIVNGISIVTKKFNQFLQEASQVRLVKMDLYMDRTPSAQISVQLFINDDDLSNPINEPLPPLPISTVSGIVTAITAANPCVVTIMPSMNVAVNNVVYFTGVLGMIQINGLSSIVTAVTPIVGGVQITLALDASAFLAYTSAGTVYNVSANAISAVNTFPETTYQNSPDTSGVNSKLWKRIYFQDISQLFQFQFTYNDNQMKCDPISSEDFVLHAMILYFSKSGRLIDV
jgi:hypothetical protein